MKPRILVADDDGAIRESLGKVLQEAGYEVVLAGNGQVAVDLFQPGNFDLLILDLNMPEKDGWEAFEDITRKDPFMAVIIMTGLENQYPFSLLAGAGALFEKPVEVAVLLETVAELLDEPREKRLERLCGRLEDTRFVSARAGVFREGIQEGPMRHLGFQGASHRKYEGETG